MMNYYTKLTVYIVLLFPFWSKTAATSNISDVSNLQFSYLTSNNGLPCDEVNYTYQDSEGFIWIGTKLGLYKYDGYQFKPFKNNSIHPSLLTSNDVTCLCEDKNNCLWIGTSYGINRLDCKTSKIRQYFLKDFDNSSVVDCILCTRNGIVWVGTDGGLYRYDANKDKFIFYCDKKHNSIIPHCSIKSLIEDHKGYMWIGTWDKGLFRYNPNSRVFYSMPKFNDNNSAHVVYEDSRHRLWIGTWGKGLYLIENPYVTNRPLSFINFYSNNQPNDLTSNYIYTICEDKATETLWVGTRHGISIRAMDSYENKFVTYPDDKQKNLTQSILGRGISSLFHDQSGRIWMSNNGGGVISTSTRPRYFNNYSLDMFIPTRFSSSIRCIAQFGKDGMLAGIDDYGLIYFKGNSGSAVLGKNIARFRSIENLTSVNAILNLPNSDCLIGTNKDGFYRVSVDNHVKQYNMENTPWLPDNCVYSFLLDNKERLLVGTWSGLCVMQRDGVGRTVNIIGNNDLSNVRIRNIMQSDDGDYWLSTDENGVIRLSGNLNIPQKMKMQQYDKTVSGSVFKLGSITKTLQDSKGRIWACSKNYGLMLYVPSENTFECVNYKYAIPGDNVSSIEEDALGHLWISTNYGIVYLSVSDDLKKADLRIFSTLDGLYNNYFGSAVSCRMMDGKLCFGNFSNFTIFNPLTMSYISGSSSARITDIKILNKSLEEYPESERDGISKLLPPYTQQITLSPEHKNITLEFSTLTYDNPQESRFAYKLEGYDKDWIYVNDGSHVANYSNLSSGTYTFLLKSTDSRGVWNKKEQPLIIVVLSPLWLRWWAFVIYTIIAAVLCYLTVIFIHRREKQRREVQLAHLESEKIEELNHKKLQFFTNFTHDMMTPLTVISATIGELEQSVPEKKSAYTIMQNNIDRLMRLLQQILEFRKAETGNLHLRVSKDDIAEFCRKEIESIQPLMRAKKMHLSLICDPQNLVCYFDPDKVDKILYNLLSNAAKYNHEMGYIQMTLTYGTDQSHVVIKVQDNGQGMTPEQQKTLFQRFYEGEHRKFKTYGTGIGLSLTRDLVKLHRGSIDVLSKYGEGTTFTVVLAVDTSFFKDEEIDKIPVLEEESPVSADSQEGQEDQTSNSIDSSKYTLLIVEDNEELLGIMRKLLIHDYKVETAMNGKEALSIIENEDIDLIVSDVMMPEMDGIELTKKLKNNIETSHIPIILLTAKREEQDRTEAYDAGADAFISKPFHLSVLNSRIHNLLKKRERSARDFKNKLVLELNDMEITNIDEDFLNRCVKCVQDHLGDADFDQQVFSDSLGTSKSTLYKKLKTLTGLNTVAFIRNIRFKAACSMIEGNPGIRISDLAYAVGYNDPKYFSSCFKKEFGMLPTEYIERFTTESKQETEPKQETE
jgi:signal transduction histidine kinase/ligand-binding sensor domain-containing protein/CheY-like chemotaxis protein/AraC-like DNA-binding protein